MRNTMFRWTACLASAMPVAVHAQVEADTGATEIVVTAQRREQRLQDVPLSVSVVSGEALQRGGLTSLEDIGARLPAVRIAQAVLADLINVRGVGSGNNPGFEQSVATFVDGVYRARSRSTRAALFDIDRLEVLKGPQTTFFGANAIAGAFNISTRKPGQTFSYNALTSYDFVTDEHIIEGGLTVPLSETLSMRAAARLMGGKGYVETPTGRGPNNDTLQGRLSLRWEPVSAFTSDLRIEGSRSRTKNAFPFEIIGCAPPVPFPLIATSTCARALAANGGSVDDKLNFHSSSPYSFANYDFGEAAWTNSVDLGSATLTSTTSYFEHKYAGRLHYAPLTFVSPVQPGLDGFPAQSTEKYHQFSQELRFQSAGGGAWEYMFGGYYSRSKIDYASYFGFFFSAFGAIPAAAALGTNASTPLTGELANIQRDDTLSAFASATIRPVEHLRINLGARYSSIRKRASRVSGTGTSINADPDTYQPFASDLQAVFFRILGSEGGQYARPRRRDSDFMPSIGLQYDLAPSLMAYASYTKGFKAGGYAYTSRTNDFEPETVNAYEFGLKGTLFDRRLTFAADVFRMDYNDLQESTVVFISGSPVSLVQNAAQSRSQGAEFNATFRLSRALSLSTDLTYLDSAYKNYPAGACTLIGVATGCQSQNLTGKRRAFSPKYSGNVALNVTIPVGDNEVRLSPSVYFTTAYFQSATADPLLEQEGYAKADVRLAFGPTDKRWEIALIGKNLTDKTTAGFRQGITGTNGTILAMPEPPRTIGVQFTLTH
ncbi:TonB-dependent receptor [Sphingobium sp. D43FB]|nr:TonB-dependent receptor [Sphingobium sp. D43FB]